MCLPRICSRFELRRVEFRLGSGPPSAGSVSLAWSIAILDTTVEDLKTHGRAPQINLFKVVLKSLKLTLSYAMSTVFGLDELDRAAKYIHVQIFALK
eukprot:sb/3478971/